MRDYAVVDSFLNLGQANVAQGVLDAAGFDSRIRDAQVGGLDWDYLPAMGGIRVEVPVERLEEARELLATRTDLYAAPSEEDRPYFESAARKRRARGFIALLFVAPVMIPIALFGLIASWRKAKAGHSGSAPG
ncbi:MAG TPA: hypothetical protein VJ885_18320 [Thermoanaerobaculia bacterium]|nr:hypothetical protein [Thermoanaerobaculia bacterium]